MMNDFNKTVKLNPEFSQPPDYYDDPWMDLYAAIAEKAVYDYKKAYYALTKNRVPKQSIKSVKKKLEKIERYLIYDNPITMDVGNIIEQIKKTAMAEGAANDERLRKLREKKLKEKPKEEEKIS